MKVLHLTLKKKWFDMIASGEKKEEYREIKGYWQQRLMHFDWVSINNISPFKKYTDYKKFDIVRFKNGYTKDAPTMEVEFKGIHAGLGNIDCGAPTLQDVFVIKLGNIINNL